jgi:hypothetical protein
LREHRRAVVGADEDGEHHLSMTRRIASSFSSQR